MDYYDSLAVITDDSVVNFCSVITGDFEQLTLSLRKIKKLEDFSRYEHEIHESIRHLITSFQNFDYFINQNEFDESEKKFFLDISGSLQRGIIIIKIDVSRNKSFSADEVDSNQIVFLLEEMISQISSSLETFLDQIKVFMKGQSAFQPSGLSPLEIFINEYDPILPKGWNETKKRSDALQLSKLQYHFYLMSNEAEDLYGIPYRISVHIYPEEKYKHAQCHYEPKYEAFNLEFYVLPKTPFSRLNRLSPLRAEYWYGMSLHECVHFLQYLLGI